MKPKRNRQGQRCIFEPPRKMDIRLSVYRRRISTTSWYELQDSSTTSVLSLCRKSLLEAIPTTFLNKACHLYSGGGKPSCGLQKYHITINWMRIIQEQRWSSGPRPYISAIGELEMPQVSILYQFHTYFLDVRSNLVKRSSKRTMSEPALVEGPIILSTKEQHATPLTKALTCFLIILSAASAFR